MTTISTFKQKDTNQDLRGRIVNVKRFQNGSLIICYSNILASARRLQDLVLNINKTLVNFTTQKEKKNITSDIHPNGAKTFLTHKPIHAIEKITESYHSFWS
jgi:hypothetical protein